MSELFLIDDPADDRVADFRDLNRAERRPDRPGGKGLVIAEGVVVVNRLIDSPYTLRALLGTQSRYEQLRGALETQTAPYYAVNAGVMAEVVGFHLNRGVLATADRPRFPEVGELLETASRLVVLEGVGDHENLGSIFRNAAALGADAVIVGPGCADPLYRRSVRVSMGNVLRVPFAITGGAMADMLNLLRSSGFLVAALTPAPESTPLSQVRVGGKVAVLLGSEGPGLSEDALAAADLRVRIPMAREVDSLNVATAGAIAFSTLFGAR